MVVNSKVTVIIPVYNGEQFIYDAIESVQNQTYTNIELILVNDGSTDKTEDIIQMYLNRFPQKFNVTYLTQSNQGKTASINLAIEKSSGEYISILDADDIYPENSIEKRSRFLDAHHNILTVYGDALLMNEQGVIYGKKPSRNVHCVHELIDFVKNPIASCSIMFRRAAMQTVNKFDERFTRLEDVNRNVSLFLAGRMQYVPEVYWYFRTYRRKEYFHYRMQTIQDSKLITSKYLDNPLRSIVLLKQFIYQLIKLLYEFVTSNK